jgi:hypothetical protein
MHVDNVKVKQIIVVVIRLDNSARAANAQSQNSKGGSNHDSSNKQKDQGKTCKNHPNSKSHATKDCWKTKQTKTEPADATPGERQKPTVTCNVCGGPHYANDPTCPKKLERQQNSDGGPTPFSNTAFKQQTNTSAAANNGQSAARTQTTTTTQNAKAPGVRSVNVEPLPEGLDDPYWNDRSNYDSSYVPKDGSNHGSSNVSNDGSNHGCSTGTNDSYNLGCSTVALDRTPPASVLLPTQHPVMFLVQGLVFNT